MAAANLVTDPDLIAQLESGSPATPGLVTDPALIAQLEAKERPPATAADRVQAGEAGIWRGASYLAALPADTAANVWNLGKAGLGTIAGEMNATPAAPLPGRTPGGLYHYLTPQGVEEFSKNPPPPGATPVMSRRVANVPSALQVNTTASPVGARLAAALDKFHDLTPTTVDRPDDALSRYIAAGTSVIPGAAVGGGGSIPGTLAATAGAAPSALAGQAVLEARPFDSDWANNAAAAGVQLGTAYGVPALAKTAIRGPSGQDTRDTAAAFRAAGAQPSLGQASGTRRTQFLESALAKIPGGAGVIQQFAKSQAEKLGSNAQDTVSSLSPNVSPEAAGEAITQGITGPGGAVEQFRNQSRALFSAVDAQVPGRQSVPVTNTLAALDQLTAPIHGAQSVSATLVNPRISGIRDAIMDDLTRPGAPGSGNALPYAALSRVRSQVGDMIGGNELISGIPRAQLKQLYGALSQDMEGAANAAGPQAAKAWSDAQDFYRSGINRMDQLSSLVDRQGGPEAIFRSAMAGTNYGASRLRTVLNSIAPDQQNTVAATVLDRMGRTTPGAQNAEGSLYSPQTFLTNWNRMSGEAKDALFGAQGSKLRDHLENTAGVAENIRDGSKVFANASGTAGAENQTEMFKHLVSLAAGALLGSGHEHGSLVGGGAALVGVPASAYALAKGMTNPAVVDWAGRPAFDSSAQAASLSAAPANIADDMKRRRLIQALQSVQ